MEIDISKYFIIHKDKRGKIFAIEQINPKKLFEAITKQNEQLHRYKQTIKDIKEIGNKDFRHTSWQKYAEQLKQIIQKCEEVNE